MEAKIVELAEHRITHPGSSPCYRPAVPAANRRRILNLWPWYRCYRVERGIVKVGDEVEIVGIKATAKSTCTGVEMFRKLLDQVRQARTVVFCCAVSSVKRSSVVRFWLSVPSTHTQFESEVYVLSKDEGGRHTPFFKATVHSSTSVPLT